MAALDESDRDILLRFKKLSRRALPSRVTKVVLYGSRARGDRDDGSDWDLAVFLEGSTPGAAERRALCDAAYDLILESGRFLAPMALASSRWDDESALIRNIRRDGVEI